jgi:type I restriction enzyme, S subunit
LIPLNATEVPKNKIVVLKDSKEKITEAGLNYSSARIIPKDSVLLTSRASIGFVAIAGCDLTTNQGFASLICSNAIFNFYLAYWLWANKDILESNAGGTTFKEISKSRLRDIKFPLPPLSEQN